MSDLREKLLAAFQVEHREHLEAVRGMLRVGAERGFTPEAFDFNEAHRRVHSLKGAARIVGLDAVEALSHRLETLMTLSQEGKVKFDRRVSDGIHLALDAIEDCAARWPESGLPREAEAASLKLAGILGEADIVPAEPVAAPPLVAPEPKVAPMTAAETARISVDSLDLVLTHARESLAEPLLQDEISGRLQALRASLEIVQREAPGLSLGGALDELREISRMHSESTWRAKRQTLRIYRDLSAMRVIPADSVFGGVRKMVRDLARMDGKEVEIDVDGLGLKADRVILQALKDPVMHLLRNAVAHGIERPETRRERGKPPIGQIAFRISAERNQLTIRIEDDGAGLDRGRILEEARRRGVLNKTAALPDSAEAVTALLLRPGFSTERRVTELAGRGMGLSVVDKAIGPLQGRFALAPRDPDGTAAIITVPLSVASSQFLLVRCGQLYAIPFRCIERIERVPLRDIVWAEGRPAYIGHARKEMVPLARLADLIGETGIGPLDGDLQIVLIKSGNGLFGLVVESLAGLQDALVHDLDDAVSGLEWIAGGLVQPDSSVCPVVNCAALEAQALGIKPSWTSAAAPRTEKRPAEILVVDDSITTRTLEKSILEARGFRVALSVDGQDAIETLRRRPVDLVIADVEMPRMDGFELVHAIKTDPLLAGIPVVLVTSRNDERDQRKGLALGADAYLVKQRFDARKLLETIDQIL